MINPTGVNNLVGKIAEQGLKESANSQQEVNASDRVRFQNALQNPARNHPDGQGLQPSTSVQTDSQANRIQSEPPHSLGDSILRGMNQMRSEAQGAADQLKAVDGSDSMTPMEALRAQLQISQVTFNAQLTGQVTGKVEQDMDTLLKSQ